ncbi:MAG TPA: hypothetical protein P5052_02115 [Candidatus Paceibacterota bacterium]|nr:hypothetical protein [Candidatus Paceibacterota bacterium]HRZ29545.1 hypothetical protein [Candidatus Paceibacterota bacterium]
MGFRKSTGPSNKDLEKMFENISSGFESSTIPSKLDSQNQNNLASLVQGLQHEDALKEEIEQLEEERKKLKEETKPF